MTALAVAVEEVLNSPPKEYTKREAQEMLQRYGVLTKKNTVTKAYSGIIIKKAEENDKRA